VFGSMSIAKLPACIGSQSLGVLFPRRPESGLLRNGISRLYPLSEAALALRCCWPRKRSLNRRMLDSVSRSRLPTTRFEHS